MRRSEIRILVLVSKLGDARVRDIVAMSGLSYSRVLQILKNLDRLGLVKLSRGRVSSVPFLSDLILQVEDRYGLLHVLRGSVPMILSKLFEARTCRDVASMVGFTEKYVRRVLDDLSRRGIVVRENDEYRLVDDALIRFFVLQFSRILEGVEVEARVVYRDNYCIIKEVERRHRARGTPTAFSVFSRYGIRVETPKEYYYYPPKRISDEEVIVHSLLVARTKREYTIVALLYAKLYYELDFEKLYFYARWFKQLDKLLRLDSYLSGSEDPLFDTWDELRELASIYGVDLSTFEMRHFRENTLREIGDKLDDAVEVYLFGGAAMVLRGYKISTKDIDMVLWREGDIDRLEKTLIRLGYKRVSNNVMKVYEKDRLSRLDIYCKKAGKLMLTKEMIERAEKTRHGNLTIYIASDTDLLLLKIVSNRPRDYEDVISLIRRGNIDWGALVDELFKQEELLNKHYCLLVYLTLSEISRKEKMHIPYLRKLARITTEHMVLVAYEHWGLKNPKDIRRVIDISEETIRRIIKRMKKTKT